MGTPNYWIADSTKAFDDTTAWSAGTVPTNTEDAIFTEDHVGACTAGASETEVLNLFVQKGYTGALGVVGTPLNVKPASGGRFEIRGSGKTYLHSTTARQSIIDCPQNTQVSYDMDANADYCTVLGGDVTLDGSCDDVLSGRSPDNGIPKLTLSNGMLASRLAFLAGNVTGTGVQFTTSMHVGDADVTWTDPSGSMPIITTVAGAAVKVLSASTAAINRILAMGGFLDMSKVRRVITLGDRCVVGQGARVNMDNGNLVTMGTGAYAKVFPSGVLLDFNNSMGAVRL